MPKLLPISSSCHVAIIMDGNGRWAKKRHLPRIEGHRRGSQVALEIIDAAYKTNISSISLFALSAENLKRPKNEIKGLILLLEGHLEKFNTMSDEKNIRLKFIGDLTFLSEKTCNAIHQIEQKSRHNNRMSLQIMLNYSGKNDILHAVKQCVHQSVAGAISPDQINADMLENNLMAADIPNIDILIRTGGDQRISNFMLWQIAYSELFFLETYWPDFNQKHLYDIIHAYKNRERRFGVLSPSEKPPLKIISEK